MTPLETPYPYQLLGADYLAQHAQSLLGDDMGLGKSCQAVRGCDLVGAEQILVICKGVGRVNWAREFTRFSPMDRPCKIMDDCTEPVPTSGVVIVSYDLLTPPTAAKAEKAVKRAKKHGSPEDVVKAAVRAKAARALHARRAEFLRALEAQHWDVLILDEAHALKDRAAGRTTSVFGRNINHPGIAGNADRIWRLTGTPAPNNASELWVHLRSAGIITMDYYAFVERYCICVEGAFNVKIVGTRNTEELKGLLAQFMLRRKKEDVLRDLPPIRYQLVTVPRTDIRMDPEIGSAFPIAEIEVQGQKLSAALAKVGGSDADILAMLEAQGPALGTLRRWTGLAKLPAILDIIEDELETGQLGKVVLFGVHQAVIEMAVKRLARFGAVALYGKTPIKQRQANIDRFMTDSSCRVFVGNVDAAGTTITLTAASEVGALEQAWVPATNIQAFMRVHRIGQTQPVRVRIFSLADSSDEQVEAVLLRKARELTKIF